MRVQTKPSPSSVDPSGAPKSESAPAEQLGGPLEIENAVSSFEPLPGAAKPAPSNPTSQPGTLPTASEETLFAPPVKRALPAFDGVQVTGKPGHKQLTYEVQRGDTLSKIAANVGSDVKSLAAHNKIAKPDALQVGQRIDLPLTHHQVEAGETYWGIAHELGIDAKTLMALNEAKPNGGLEVGEQIRVPATASAQVQGTHHHQPSHTKTHVRVPAALAELGKTAAFQKLSPSEQRQLVALAGAKSTYGQAVMTALHSLVASSDFKKASPQAQSKQLHDTLQSATPYLVGPEGKLAKPAPYRLGTPTLEKQHPFPGKTTDADVYPVQIDGRTIQIYLPHDRAFKPPEQLPADQIALTLAEMAPESRAQVKSVSADPVQNPDDAYWAKQYNTPNFVSYMTCGSDGAANIYPQDSEPDEADIVESLTHETGHAWSLRDWGDTGDSAKWDAWKKACQEDGPLPPSQYAQSDPTEDVAESTAMYLVSRGTPAFAEYRAMFPHRFKILDQQFGAKA